MGQLLWEQDSIERGKITADFYTMLHREPSAKRFTGTVFEPPFHDLCVRGTTFTLYPMTKRTEGSSSYIFVNYPPATLETLVLLPQTRVVFNRKSPVTRLLANYYYQPTTGNQPSYDAFIYEPIFRLLTSIQVTEGEFHGLKPKGIYGLRDLAQRLGINGLKLRVVIVVPEDYHQVECPVEKVMYDNLGFEMYYIEVIESELYENCGNVNVSQTVM